MPMIRTLVDDDGGGRVLSGPVGGGVGSPTLVRPKKFQITFIHTELLPITLLKGFRIVIYTGNDPNDTSQYLKNPIELGPSETGVVVSLAVQSQTLFNASVQALYKNGDEGAWRNVGGTTTLDPDTKSLADDASVTAITNRLNAISNDAIISDDERPDLKTMRAVYYARMVASQAKAAAMVPTQTGSASYIALTAAWAAFVANVTPVIDGTGNTAIVKATWDGYWSNVETCIENLNGANTNIAQGTGNAAQTSANTANADLANIFSDGLLTPDEKPRVILDYNTITAEQAGIDAQATAYGITTEKTTYDTAVSALTTYLATLTTPVLWSNLSGNTTATGATSRTKFGDVYTTRQTLLNGIYAAAKTLADAAQGTGNSAIARTSIAKTLEYWTFSGTSSIVTLTDGMSGTKALRMPAGAGFPNAGAYHVIDPTRSYKTKFYARASVGCDGLLYFSLRQFTDNVGTPTAINAGRWPYYPSGQPAHTAWVLYEHVWKGSDFQAGVRFVQPDFLGNYAGTLGYWEIQDFNFFEITETDAAQIAANAAQIAANAANADLANIFSDGLLTPDEKPRVILDYNTITAEQAGIDTQAAAYGVSRIAYDAAVSALTAYLATLTMPVLWSNLAGNTTATGTTSRQKFGDVYTTRQTLLNGIYAAAKALADAAQATGNTALGSSLIPNPNFEFPITVNDWPTMTRVARASAPAGCPTAFCGKATVREQLCTPKFPVTPGMKISAEAWIDTTLANEVCNFGVYYADSAGVLFGVGYAGAGVAAGLTWNKLSGIIVVPAGAINAHPFIQMEATSNFGSAFFTGLRLSEAGAAQTGVNQINSVDYLTNSDKIALMKDWNAELNTQTKLLAAANPISVSHTAYDNAVTAIDTLLMTTLGYTAWKTSWPDNATSGPNISVLNTLRSLWNTVASERAGLQSGITTQQAANAQAAAISAAATDASTKANLAQLQSQPHQVAWAYAAKPALPSALYPAGYYAITTDSRTVQVNPAGTAWTDVLVAATGLFGKLFTSQLVVSGGLGGALNPDPNCEDQTAWYGLWSNPVATVTAITDGKIGNSVLRSTAGVNNYNTSSKMIPCDSAKVYRISAWVRSSATANGVLIIRTIQCTGSEALNGGVDFYHGLEAIHPPSGTWTRYSATFSPAAGKVNFSPFVLLNYSGTLGYMEAQDIRIEEVIDGSLIVDGGLTAAKIKAGEIKSLAPAYVQDASGNATAGFKLGNDGSDPTPRGAKFAAGDIRIGSRDFTDYWFRLLQGIDNPTSSLVVWRGNNDVTARGGAPLIADNDANPAVNPRLLINTVKIDNTGSWFGSTTLHFQCQPLANTDNLDSMSHVACIAYRKTGSTMALGDRNAANAYFYPTISSRRYKTYLTPSDTSNAGHGMHVWTSPNALVVNDCTEGLSGSNYPLVLVAQLCNVHGDSTAHYFIPPSLVGNGNLSTTGRWTDVGNVVPYTGGGAPPTGGGGGGGVCPAPWLKVTLASGLLVDAGDLYNGAVLKGADDSSFASMTGTVSDYQKVWRTRLQVVLEDGSALVFSRDHRLAVIDRGWVTVQDLRAGDLLMAERHAIVKCVEPFPDGIVCGFVVSGCHTYFTDGILSHNIKAPNA